MLSNGDKKKIGAMAGIVVIGTGLLFGLIRMNDKPKEIVGEEYSFLSNTEPSEESRVEESVQEKSSVSKKSNKTEKTNEKKPETSYGSTRLPEQSSQEKAPISSNAVDLHASQGKLEDSTEEKESATAESKLPEQSSELLESSTSDSSSVKEEGGEENSKESKPSESSDKVEETAPTEGKESDSTTLPESSASEKDDESSSEKNEPGSQKEEASTSGSTEADSSSAPESEESLEEKPNALHTEIAAALAGKTVYEKQTLGNTAVPFYQHPSLSVGMDLRDQSAMQQELYIEPTSEGFLIFPRTMLSVLGITPDSLSDYLAEGSTIPGAITVKRVDKATRDAMEKADTAGAMRFVEAEGGMFYAIQSDDAERKAYQGIYDVLSHELTPQLVADHLTTVGLIGELKPERSDVTLAQQQHQWESLVMEMKQSASDIEMKWNLPLLADSNAYKSDGQDVRKNVPAPGVNASYGDSSATGNPAYSFGRTDLNGDAIPEYVIRAQVGEMQSGESDGYWAILEPTAAGLKVANVVLQGNGDLYLRGDNMILPSLEREGNAFTLTLSEVKVGEEAREDFPSLTFTLVDGESGQTLAEQYPDDSLVVMNNQIYRFSMQELDGFMDYVLNQLGKAERLTFVGHMTEPESGTVNPDGMQRASVEDPTEVLSKSYPELPLSKKVIDTAVSTIQFQSLTDPLTVENFAK